MRELNSRRRCFAGRRRLLVELLEDRRLLTCGGDGICQTDFEVLGANQFGPGRALALAEEQFIGFDERVPLNVNLYDTFTDTGVKLDLALDLNAGIKFGYVVNSGSLDLFYNDVALEYRAEEGGELSLGDRVPLTSEVIFDNSLDSYFTTTSPTVGAYADVLANASLSGSATGKLFGFGGTAPISTSLINLEQELLAFNRNDDREIRILGVSALATEGTQIEIGAGAFQLTGAVAPLDDEGKDRIGLQGELFLRYGIDPEDLVPGNIKKKFSPDKLDEVLSVLEGAGGVGVQTRLAELQLEVPEVNLFQQLGTESSGQMTATVTEQVASLLFSLGLDDVGFNVGPATFTVTPAVLKLGPEIAIKQTSTISPSSRLNYRFDRPVNGTINSVAFVNQTEISFTVGDDVELEFRGTVEVTPFWDFKAELHNDFDIEVGLARELKALQARADISGLPAALRGLLDLPWRTPAVIDIQDLPVELWTTIDLVDLRFSVIDHRVPLTPFTIGADFEFDLTVGSFSETGNSLRKAIRNANFQDEFDDPQELTQNVIQLKAGTFSLSSTSDPDGSNDLDVTDSNLLIEGQGAGITIITANDLSRVFDVHPGGKLTLKGLTITGGRGSGGGAIQSLGDLELIDVVIENNTSVSNGGGILQQGGQLIVTRSEITGNRAAGTGNTTGSFYGGGIYANNASVIIRDSSIVNNQVLNVVFGNGYGGGIWSGGNAVTTILRTTVSSNESNYGAAIFAPDSSSLAISASTITRNRSNRNSPLLMSSSVVASLGTSINHTIIAGNFVTGSTPRDISFTAAPPPSNLQENIVGGGDTHRFPISNNLVGITNPRLTELGDYGGPTRTHLLLPDSPAIGRSSNLLDQRGLTSTDSVGDIGSTQYFNNAIRIVASGEVASPLQDAVDLLMAQGGGTIVLGPGTHRLETTLSTDQDVDILSGTILIQGDVSNPFTPSIIDGAALRSRIFEVHAGATLNLQDVAITGGAATNPGGAISNAGILNVTRSKLYNNLTTQSGGAIWTASAGITNLVDSTITANTAERGGGLGNSGTTTISGSLIANNRALGKEGMIGSGGAGAGGGGAGLGGGIYNEGELTLSRSTISSNEAAGGRGGNSSSATLLPINLTANDGGRGGGTQGGAGGLVIVDPVLGLAAIDFQPGSAGGFGGGGGGGAGDGDVIFLAGLVGEEGGNGGAFGGGGSAGLQDSPQGAGGAGGIYGGAGGRGVSSQGTVLDFTRGVGGSGGGGAGVGGAIFVYDGSVTIEDSTIHGNKSKGGEAGQTVTAEPTSASMGSGVTGGVYRRTGTVNIANSVIAGNLADVQSPNLAQYNDVNGLFVSLGNNFIGVAHDSAGFNSPTDMRGIPNLQTPSGDQQIEISNNVLDPRLLPLRDNGGPTPTHLPAHDSPLVNAGATTQNIDQRGSARPIGLVDDIGSVELENMTVESFVDNPDVLSLRRAIIDANRLIGTGREVVVRLTAGQYWLDRVGGDNSALVGDLDILSGARLRIVGAGAGQTFINGSLLDDVVFSVQPGAQLTLDGVTLIAANSGVSVARGIVNQGLVLINNSHITLARGGSAIRNMTNATLVVSNSSLTGNVHQTGDGGAIFNEGTFFTSNSTYATNFARKGGAIFNRGPLATFTNVTIAGNSANAGAGGLHSLFGEERITNSIIANNSGPFAADLNIEAGRVLSSGHNIFEQVRYTANPGASLDYIGVDPLLGPFSNTALPHYPLLVNSIGVDRGQGAGSGLDNIGNPRMLGNKVDIGAVESVFLKVSELSDSLVPGSLRYAVRTANQLPGEDLITFAPVLNGVPVPISDQIEITEGLQIVGNGSKETLLHGAEASRLFNIVLPTDLGFTNRNIRFAQMTLSGGRTIQSSATGAGGAVRAQAANLAFDTVELVNNSVTGQSSSGGAIAVFDGRLDIVGSTFEGNSSSTGSGGAINIAQTALNISNSTFHDNHAAVFGGAILLRDYADTVANLSHVTIQGNTASQGGGIAYTRADVNLSNAIVAGNLATGTGNDLRAVSANLVPHFSLIGDSTHTSLTETGADQPDANGNLVGGTTIATFIDPLLGLLQDNGGPTRTLALRGNSPAIDAGGELLDPSEEILLESAYLFDQRGFERDNRLDMGAFEVQQIQGFYVPRNRTDLTLENFGTDRLKLSYLTSGTYVEQIVATPSIAANIAPLAPEIPPQVMGEGALLGPIFFNVEDPAVNASPQDPDSLLVTAISSNPLLLPNESITIIGTGSQRAMYIAPPRDLNTYGEEIWVTVSVADAYDSNGVVVPIVIEPQHDIVLPSEVANDVIVRREGNAVEIVDATNLSLLHSIPLSESNSLGIAGVDGAVDSLTVDFGYGGFFEFPNGIELLGGDHHDSIRIVGLGETDVEYFSVDSIRPIGELKLSQAVAAETLRLAGFGQVTIDGVSSFLASGVLSIGQENWVVNSTSPLDLPFETVIDGGSLIASSGALLESGEIIRGTGRISTPNSQLYPFVNNGEVQGTSQAEALTLTGYVTGSGVFDNVIVDGTLSPGIGQESLAVGNLVFGPNAVLMLEFGGIDHGTQYDSINADFVELAGTLELSLVNGFLPEDQFEFVIMRAAVGVSGRFDNLPEGGVIAVGSALMTISYAGGATGNDLVLRADMAPPSITSVQAGSTNWSTSFTALFADNNQLGYSIPFDDQQLRTLPWPGIDRLYIQLNESVQSVDPTQIRLQGINVEDYGAHIENVEFDSSTHMITIRMSHAIGSDKLLLTIRDTIRDQVGRQLDGDFETGSGVEQSGNGQSGGDFEFRFNVLLGDMNGDGIVEGGDLLTFSDAFFTFAGTPGFNPNADLNGDGFVEGGDLNIFSDHFFTFLPFGEPGQLGLSSFQQTRVIDESSSKRRSEAKRQMQAGTEKGSPIEFGTLRAESSSGGFPLDWVDQRVDEDEEDLVKSNRAKAVDAVFESLPSTMHRRFVSPHRQ